MDNKTILLIIVTLGIAGLFLLKKKIPIIPEPVSQWKFDEGEGNIAYDSMGLNDLKIYNSEWVTERGNALRFNGIDSYANTNISPSLNLFGGDVTIAGWVKFNAPPTSYEGIYNYHSVGGWYSMYQSIFDNLHMRINLGYGEGDTVFKIGEWYFLVCIYNSGTNEIIQYVDNIKQNITYYDTHGWGTMGSDVSAFVGAYDETREFLNADVQNLRIWNVVLTDKEILDIYNYEK